MSLHVRLGRQSKLQGSHALELPTGAPIYQGRFSPSSPISDPRLGTRPTRNGHDFGFELGLGMTLSRVSSTVEWGLDGLLKALSPALGRSATLDHAPLAVSAEWACAELRFCACFMFMAQPFCRSAMGSGADDCDWATRTAIQHGRRRRCFVGRGVLVQE